MHQSRILSRAEGLLRDPATGLANLAAAPGVWHACAPRFADERFELVAVGLVLAGPGLLARLESFAGQAATLELAIDLFDGYGAVRDLANLLPLRVASAPEWNAGTHAGTHAAADAGALADGAARLGLKGLPIVFALAAPASASWTSAAMPLRYGSTLEALSWDAWLLTNASGDSVAPPRLEVRTGSVAAGAVVWNAWTLAASTVAEVEAGGATLAAPPGGELMQLRVTLPYQDPGTASPERETVVRTATLFSLCAWIRQDAGRWRFANVAELIDRSEVGRHLAAQAWAGADDVAILRLPMAASLRGAHGERLRARFTVNPTGSSGAAAPVLSRVEAFAIADLRFDATKS